MKKLFAILVIALFAFTAPVFADSWVDTQGGALLSLENVHTYGAGTSFADTGYKANGEHFATGNAENCGYVKGNSYNNGNNAMTWNKAGVASSVEAIGRNTEVYTVGQAWQGNETGVGNNGTFAGGGNFSVGAYSSEDEGYCYSKAAGAAGAAGFTAVSKNEGAYTNSSHGMTASGSFAFGDDTFVAGGGGIDTGAYKTSNGSVAIAGSTASYGYQGDNYGGGSAWGSSETTVVQAGNGVYGHSTASSGAVAGAN